MITAKNKPHFWSQLLFSLIAILALPTVSALENQSVNHDNLSNQQRHMISHVERVAMMVKQVQEITFQPSHSLGIVSILHEIEPHFVAIELFIHVPIRAGPQLIS